MTHTDESEQPIRITLAMTQSDLDQLTQTSVEWSRFADQNDGRFEYDESLDPWDSKWDTAWISFHGSTSYVDALLARAYFTAIGIEWIALWDTAEHSNGQPWGHVTVHFR